VGVSRMKFVRITKDVSVSRSFRLAKTS